MISRLAPLCPSEAHVGGRAQARVDRWMTQANAFLSSPQSLSRGAHGLRWGLQVLCSLPGIGRKSLPPPWPQFPRWEVKEPRTPSGFILCSQVPGLLGVRGTQRPGSTCKRPCLSSLTCFHALTDTGVLRLFLGFLWTLSCTISLNKGCHGIYLIPTMCNPACVAKVRHGIWSRAEWEGKEPQPERYLGIRKKPQALHRSPSPEGQHQRPSCRTEEERGAERWWPRGAGCPPPRASAGQSC